MFLKVIASEKCSLNPEYKSSWTNEKFNFNYFQGIVKSGWKRRGFVEKISFSKNMWWLWGIFQKWSFRATWKRLDLRGSQCTCVG